MNPDRTIKTTATGRRAAAARDGRIERGQEPTRPIAASSEAPAAAGGHTPGPWRLNRGVEVIADTKGGTATRSVARVDTGFPENDANAALIAAAPEMLAALLHAEDVLADAKSRGDLGPHETGTLEAVRAAIIKARGRL